MQQFTQTQIDALSKMVAPDRFSTGQSNRELHIKDISPHRGELPAGIIWPVTTEEVSTILAYTYIEGIPVTPWGTGTSSQGLSGAGERKVQVENGALLSGLAGQVLDGDPHHRRLVHSFVDIGIPGKTGQLKKEFVKRG